MTHNCVTRVIYIFMRTHTAHKGSNIIRVQILGTHERELEYLIF